MTQFPPAGFLNPEKTIQFWYVITAKMSNPNGDPDNANFPRTNPFTGQGIISAGSIKRKIRDYIQERYANAPGNDIFIRNGESMEIVARGALNKAGLEIGPEKEFEEDDIYVLMEYELPENFKIIENTVQYDGEMKATSKKALLKELKDTSLSAQGLKDMEEVLGMSGKKIDKKESVPIITKSFIDARLFGFTDPSTSGVNKGPLQMTDALSLKPVNILDITMTRVAQAKNNEKEGGSFGHRYVVDEATYIGRATYNAPYGVKHAVSEQDLKLFVEGLFYGQELAQSSSRPDVRTSSVLIVTHDSPYRNASVQEIEKLINFSEDGKINIQENSLKAISEHLNAFVVS